MSIKNVCVVIGRRAKQSYLLTRASSILQQNFERNERDKRNKRNESVESNESKVSNERKATNIKDFQKK